MNLNTTRFYCTWYLDKVYGNVNMEYSNLYLSTPQNVFRGTQRWQYIHFKILRSNYTLNYFVRMISSENLTNRKYTYVLVWQLLLYFEQIQMENKEHIKQGIKNR